MRRSVQAPFTACRCTPHGEQPRPMMLQPRPHAARIRRLLPTMVAAALVIAVAAPLAGAETVEFRSAAPERGITLGDEQPDQGVTGTVKFRLSAADRRARNAAREQQRLRDKADRSSAAATRADQRIAAIQELLDGVEEDQARLEQVIKSRLVERYKDGDVGDITFLLSGDGMSDLVTRSEVLKDQSARDRRTLHEYDVTLDRVELYRQVLEELRDINSEQSRDLRDRADRLDDVLVAAKAGHDEAPESEADADAKGVKGTWYVMDGAFTAQLFLPNAGSGYSGGTRTPARRATPLQIQTVLNDPRIELDASGYQDVLTGQIDGRLLDAMTAAAARFNVIKITSLKGDHGVYTASGNVSEHSYGCAMDIGTIGSTYITPGSQTPGSEVEQAVLFFNGLGTLTGKPDLAPHQVISLFDLGGATLSMGDHGDHIHVGYSC